MSEFSALWQLAAKSLQAESQERVEAERRACSVAFQIKALAAHLDQWVRALNQAGPSGAEVALLEQRPSEIHMLGVGWSERINSLDLDITIGAKTLYIRLKDFAFGDDVVAEVNGPLRCYELRLSDTWGVYRQRSDVPEGLYDLEGPAPLDQTTFVELATSLFEDPNWR